MPTKKEMPLCQPNGVPRPGKFLMSYDDDDPSLGQVRQGEGRDSSKVLFANAVEWTIWSYQTPRSGWGFLPLRDTQDKASGVATSRRPEDRSARAQTSRRRPSIGQVRRHRRNRAGVQDRGRLSSTPTASKQVQRTARVTEAEVGRESEKIGRRQTDKES